MSYEVETLVRRVDDLPNPDWLNNVSDSSNLLYLSESKKAVFERNPFLRDKNQPAQFIGMVDGHVMGRLNPFTYQIVADGYIYEVAAGDSLFVEEKYRGTMYALDLIDMQTQAAQGLATLNCGLSKAAQKFVKLNGDTIFYLERFVLFSRCDDFLKGRIREVFRKILSPILNVVLVLYRKLLSMLVWLRTWRWKIEKISLSNKVAIKEFCDQISKDEHRFRVNITPEWIEWVLGNDFFGDTNPEKTLYRISTRGKLIGYALARFGENGRGRRGKILDWQIVPECRRISSWLFLRIATKIADKCDVVVLQIPEDDKSMRTLSRFLLRLPRQMAVLHCAEDSPLTRHPGYADKTNWRIRPSIGDACFY